MSGYSPGGRGGGPGRGAGRPSYTLFPKHGSNTSSPGGSPNRARGGGYRGSSPRGRGGNDFGGHDTGPKVFSPENVQKPSQKVQDAENKIEKALKSDSSLSMQKLVLNSSFPQRPAYGTAGQAVTLTANFLELVQHSTLLYRYKVEILEHAREKMPSGKKAKQVIKLMIEQNFSDSVGSLATDYLTLIISTRDLNPQNGILQVEYRFEDGADPQPNPTIFSVRLQPTGVLNLSDLSDYVNSTDSNAVCGNKDDLIQALNIIVGHHPKTDTMTRSKGANQHFSTMPEIMEIKALGSGLEALRGYFVSARPATARILLNVQVRHAAWYEAIPLHHLMSEYRSQNGLDLKKLAKYVEGLRVKVTHIVRRNGAGDEIVRIKTIKGFATMVDGQSKNPTKTAPIVKRFGAGSKEVQFHRDTYISVDDFFRQTYNIHIQHPDLPVVNVGTLENPSYLPAEVCIVVSGQAFNGKLEPKQSKGMIDFAVRYPHMNAESITTRGLRTLGITPQLNSTLKGFAIYPAPNLITVPGRVLTAPQVQYNKKYKDEIGKANITPGFGTWNIRDKLLSVGGTMPPWVYLWISIEDQKDAWTNEQQLQRSLNEFTSTMNSCGIKSTGAIISASGRLRVKRTSYEAKSELNKMIEERFKAIFQHNTHPKLIVVIIPRKDAAVYNQIKFLGDVKFGIHTICMVGSNLAKENVQCLANVGLKANLKFGGINQSLSPTTAFGILAHGKTMVVGYDVTHPSPGSASNAPSIAAIVASVDSHLGQWPAEIRTQTSKQEMVADLKAMMKSRLRLWEKKNNQLPENILIYRDGVSEGQYNVVLNSEEPLIREACAETYSPKITAQGLPRISIIIVGKRHHTRFYPTDLAEADRTGNTKNGTVVDRGVTEARNWDFYLQAHSALKGTARPAHYFVILDEIFRTQTQPGPANAANALEDLTHNLCYMFGRATKAVSICPPAYYADLACERARCYLSSVFDPSLGSTQAQKNAAGVPFRPEDVIIHANLKDSMFYI